MTIVKSVGVISVGKAFGALYALLGILIGGIITLMSLAGAAAAGKGGAGGMLFGVGAVVVIPLVYGVMGFIGGIIMAALYNVVASFAGGIELELTDGYSSRSRRRSHDDYEDEDR